MNAKTTTALCFCSLLSTFSVGCAGFEADDGFESMASDGDDDGRGENGAEGGGSGDDSRAGDGDGCGGDGDGDGAGEDPVRDDAGGGVCEAFSTHLIAGQHTDTGSVIVSNDDDELFVSVDAASPYLLAEVHIYVGVEEVPLNNGGVPAPGQFPYVIELEQPSASYKLAVALADLGVGCNESLNVAVHAVVVSFDEQGNEVFAETAWGFGDETFAGSRWGWSFDYGVCCEIPREPEDEGCTLTRGYWQTHNSAASVPALQIEWPISESTELCGMTWLDILHTEPNGDAFIILASQWIAASLNIASGASTPAEVDEAMASAADYLSACSISDVQRSDALAVSTLLDDYNNGLVGPGHCE